MNVVAQRDDKCETAVKENDNDGWSSDGVVLWLGRRQNRYVVGWWGEWPRLRWSFYSSGGEVGRSGESSLRGWCGFNISVLTWEGRRWNKALAEYELKSSSLFWLNEKEMWHGAAVWRCRSEERWHRGRKREEMTPVGLTWILLNRKWRKYIRSI
jgi:hypothetical protein